VPADGRGRDEDFSSPPAQIPACAANAPGSSLGFWRRSGDKAAGVSDWRKEAGDELDEPPPAEAGRLAAPLERCEPEPLHLVEEPPQVRMVTRDSEVVQMPFQHLFHPSPGFRDGVVHYSAQLDLDRQQLGSHPLLDRLAPDDERAPFA
jgi:hypothetical protein